MIRPFLLLLAVLLGALPGPLSRPAAATENFSIAQLYAAATPLPGVRFAKVFAEHAYIVTPSYRLQPEQVRRIWNDPRYGAQVKALIAEDYFLRDGRFAAFYDANQRRLAKASFFESGFIMLQLQNPEEAVIVPVSIVTAQKAETAVRTALKTAPELLRP